MRVVSLVPSLTEAVAVTAPGLLVAATDWCTHPAGLDVVRVGGTKNPDTARITALAPDLVIANEEENRPADLAALRAAGLTVLVTEVRTLDQGFAELHRVLTEGCGLDRPGWLDEAEAAWRDLPAPHRRVRAVIPVWRRPWMVLGRATFAGDLLARLGVDNLYAGHPDRYPKAGIGELRASGAELVVLPDEPYRFTADDGPEAFPGLPAALVGGRHLTWYGPSLRQAPEVLGAALAAARKTVSRPGRCGRTRTPRPPSPTPAPRRGPRPAPDATGPPRRSRGRGVRGLPRCRRGRGRWRSARGRGGRRPGGDGWPPGRRRQPAGRYGCRAPGSPGARRRHRRPGCARRGPPGPAGVAARCRRRARSSAACPGRCRAPAPRAPTRRPAAPVPRRPAPAPACRNSGGVPGRTAPGPGPRRRPGSARRAGPPPPRPRPGRPAAA
ncbi:hypothetical protein SCATT_51850 [Streptantibioticus cattleyicolor NRRL 8057 = DSM 46488]|uniref:Fe/B12 periplasmic-binding domain-containing protein n=1 Tax=Streptantibioticus cattleyicolor (strain ATCC 35852 / DSM 46488 / JCM 4925 / NBRC 14057 / NRRL 8057) TaxID=1003195 RepID=G8WY18_STREN|nr:hypothetical protein SCATT_51850 [Streptantibioticus cattleyicolor NRRL 8057 = DSM 46488]